MTTKTIYISIGNSDDKLTQNEWAHFYAEVEHAIAATCTTMHGRWFSAGDSAFQNACWCVDLFAEHEPRLRGMLSRAAKAWQQDSIAWAEATTEFIKPEVA